MPLKTLTQKEINHLYAKQKALRVALHAAMNAVPDIEIPTGASETEISELDTLLCAQIKKAATPFMQDFRDWRDSLTLQERQALGLEMTPEREAYIDDHVADVCGA